MSILIYFLACLSGGPETVSTGGGGLATVDDGGLNWTG